MTKPIEKWAKFRWPKNEEWRPAPGFDGYEVSDRGRLRSLRRSNARLVNPTHHENGMLRVQLSRDGVRVHQVLARLICEAFNGAPPPGMNCCHEDGDYTNNRPGNLRWDTQAGNMADKRRHGTHQAGSKHPNASIDEDMARRVKASVGRAKEVAALLGVSVHVVNDIRSGKAWRHA